MSNWFFKIKTFLLNSNLLTVLAVLILILGYYLRLSMAFAPQNLGGDDFTHIEAVETFIDGKNPYKYTVESYDNLEKAPASKGYAYFPAILYVYTLLYKFAAALPNAEFFTHSFFLLPGVLADFAIGIFLFLYFCKKDKLVMLYSVMFWTFNYFFLARNTLARFDSVPVLFLLLALYQLGKSGVKSGILFSLSVLFKTFPVILFPLFIFKSKNPLKFLLAGFAIALIFSLPFITSPQEISTYIQGTLFVHSDRFVQGRPFLYYLSYLFSIEFFRVVPFGFYSIGSIVFGWIFLVANRVFGWINNKYVASIYPFVIFYLLTPVLNRTFLLWWIPFLLLGTYRLFEKRNLSFFYIITGIFWAFFYWYLSQWDNGLHDGLKVGFIV